MDTRRGTCSTCSLGTRGVEEITGGATVTLVSGVAENHLLKGKAEVTVWTSLGHRRRFGIAALDYRRVLNCNRKKYGPLVNL